MTATVEIASGPVGQARAALFAALEPLLDAGRVQPYDDAMPTPPAIAIGSPRIGTRAVGGANVTMATFPVIIRVDGAKVAQMRKLDELVPQVWLAVREVKSRICRAVASTPSSSDITGGGTSSTRTQTVDVEIAVDPIAWCPPAPETE